MTTSLSGRTAVVTGASRGIGAGIASALADKGVRVVLIARNEAKLKEVAKRLKGSIPLACDVSDPKSVEKAAKRIETELRGAPDILVNNAGIFGVSIVEDTKTEFFVDTINTNLVGPFLFARAFLRAMKERKSGHIVTIGSSRTEPSSRETLPTLPPSSGCARSTKCCAPSCAEPGYGRL